MIAGALEVQMFMELARIKQDMGKARDIVTSGAKAMEDAAASVRTALGGITGGLSVAAFGAWIKGAIDAADALNDLSKSTDIAVGKLAGLKMAAKQSGSDLEGTAKSINKLQLEIGKDAEKFAKIGITAKDGLGAFQQLSDIFKEIKDPQLRAAVAAEALGKSWAGAAPLLSEGSKKIQEMVDKGERLSGMSQRSADASDEFNDRMVELQTALGGTATKIANDLLPLLTALAEDLTTTSTDVNGLESSFNPLTETLRAVIIFLGEVAFALKGVGTEIGVLAAQADALGLSFTDMLNPAAAAAKAVTAGGEAWRKFNAIGAEARADAEKNRAAHDAWIKKMLEAGKAATVVATETKNSADAMTAQREAALRAFVAQEAAKAAAAALAKELAEQAKLLAELSGLTGSFAEDWDRLNRMFQAGRINLDQLVKAQADLLAKQPAIKQAADERAKAMKNEAEAAKQLLDVIAEIDLQWSKDAEERDKIALAISDQRRALEDTNAELKLEAGLLGSTDRERAVALGNLRVETELRKKLEELNRSMAYSGTNEKEIARLAAERAMRAQQLRDNADIESQHVSERAALEEQVAILNSIDSTAHDVWTNIWETGTNVFKKLGQTLKASLLDLLYQMTVKKWIFNIFASVTGGASGIAGMAANGAVQGGMSSMLGGAAGSLGGNSVLGGIGSAFMSGYSGAAAVGTGASFASTIGAGLATDAMGATVIEGAAAAGIETGIGAGVSAGLASIPVVGWIALAGMVLYSMFGESPGGPKGNAFAQTAGMTGVGQLPGDVSKDLTTAAQQGITAITGGYMSAAAALGLQAGQLEVAIQANTDPEGDSLSHLAAVAKLNGKQIYDRNNLTDPSVAKNNAMWEDVGRSPEEMQAAIQLASARAILSALKATDMPQQLADYFDKLDPLQLSAEQISSAITAATNANKVWIAFGALGPVFADLTDLTVEATTSFITAAGGIEALGTNLAAYVAAFYTEGERAAMAMVPIAKAFSDMGLALPNTVKEFRALVEAQDRSTEAGRRTTAALLGVAGAFAEVTSAIQTATRAALQEVADSLRNMHDAVDEANGKVADARSKIASAYTGAQDRLNRLLEQSRQATLAFGNSLRDYLAGLSTGQFATESPAGQYAALQRQLFATAEAAKGGDQHARDGLTAAANAFLQAAQDRSRSAIELAMDRSSVRTLLDGVLSSLPASAQPGAGPTLDDQILAAQQEVADYLALANETGTNIEGATLTVADNIAALRDSYEAARTEQALANARLDVALAALDALGLTEEAINSLLAGQTGASIGDFATALGVSDSTIAALQAAMGFTDDELQNLSDALNVKVSDTVLNALANSLGLPPAAVASMATALGVSTVQMSALATSLNLSEPTAAMLSTILGLSPAQRDDLAVVLGVDVTQYAALGTALGFDAEKVKTLGTALGIADTVMTALDAALGASQPVLDDLAVALGLSDPQKTALANSLNISSITSGALAQVLGVSDTGWTALAIARGINPGASTAASTALGLQDGLLGTLGASLGLNAGAISAINSLVSATAARDASVGIIEQAYASIGRTGFGTGVNQIDSAGFSYWLNALQSGSVSSSSFQSAFLSDAAAWVQARPDDPLSAYVKPYLQGMGIPGLATGTNFVPDTMLSVLHPGEEVKPAKYVDADRSAQEETNRLLGQLQVALDTANSRLAYLEKIERHVDDSNVTLTGIRNGDVTVQTEVAA